MKFRAPRWRSRSLPQQPPDEQVDQFDQVQEIRDLQAIASGDLSGIKPRRMTEDQLVKAAWGYLHVEERDLTIGETRDALNCTA